MDSFKNHSQIKGKKSLCLVNWQLFLSKYIDCIEIRYRPRKTYLNADSLSRLGIATTIETPMLVQICQVLLQNYDIEALEIEMTEASGQMSSGPGPETVSEDIAKTELMPSMLHWLLALPIDADNNEEAPAETLLDYRETEDAIKQDLFITQLYMQKGFLASIVVYMPHDLVFGKFYKKLRQQYQDTKRNPEGPKAMLESFWYNKSGLLYFRDHEYKYERICISQRCQREV